MSKTVLFILAIQIISCQNANFLANNVSGSLRADPINDGTPQTYQRARVRSSARFDENGVLIEGDAESNAESGDKKEQRQQRKQGQDGQQRNQDLEQFIKARQERQRLQMQQQIVKEEEEISKRERRRLRREQRRLERQNRKKQTEESVTESEDDKEPASQRDSGYLRNYDNRTFFARYNNQQ